MKKLSFALLLLPFYTSCLVAEAAFGHAPVAANFEERINSHFISSTKVITLAVPASAVLLPSQRTERAQGRAVPQTQCTEPAQHHVASPAQHADPAQHRVASPAQCTEPAQRRASPSAVY